MRSIYIYTLSCPKTGAARYVGKTINIKKRIDDHLHNPRKLPCSRWIQSLKKEGLKPVVHIIDEITEDWEITEQYWISQFKTWGFKLLNLTDGGEGSHGIKQSREHKDKRRLSMLGKNTGRKLSEDFKRKLSQTQLATDKNKGFNNPKCRYSREQIIEVKRLLNEGMLSKIDIARKLNVNRNLVYEISYNAKWSDI